MWKIKYNNKLKKVSEKTERKFLFNWRFLLSIITIIIFITFISIWFFIYALNYNFSQNIAILIIFGSITGGFVTTIWTPLGGIIWLITQIIVILDFIFIQNMNYFFGFINYCGILFLIIGTFIRYLARRTLKKYFSRRLIISNDHKLVIKGLYKYVRHPAYLGSMFLSFGIPLLLSSIFGFITALIYFPYIHYRIKIEEDMLIKKFGEEYLNYKKKAKKLIPFIY